MKKHIENLIRFAIDTNLIEQRDYVYVKNQLYALLNLVNTGEEILEVTKISTPSEALNPILDILEENNILDGSIIQRDLFDAKIMNIFVGLPSSIEQKYNYLNETKSSKEATKWLFNFAKNINYIRYDRILKNRYFEVATNSGNLQITINLSKPEKDPKSIALALKQTSTQYPKCVLCIENEGFSGNLQRDSRNQHRLLKFELNNENWYFQYSPYIYYNEHSIILSEQHRPMKIGEHTFSNLLGLTDKFDGYFFGSNADLPIVGGSILTHDHYQGGAHIFPIESSKISKEFKENDLTIQSLLWPLTTIRLISKNKDLLVKKATFILNKWKNYNNLSLDILSHSNEVPHNTITPIARIKNGYYELDLILRNNRTTDEFPLGIFHPHADKWHIKKENIGLIEAAGMAILPARLITEMDNVKDYLLNHTPLSDDAKKHEAWVNVIKKKYTFTKENIDTIIENEIGYVFEKVLIDCGVFKLKDIDQLNKFIEEQLYEKLS